MRGCPSEVNSSPLDMEYFQNFLLPTYFQKGNPICVTAPLSWFFKIFVYLAIKEKVQLRNTFRLQLER